MKRENGAWASIMNALFVGVLGFLVGMVLMTNLNVNQKRELDAGRLLAEDQSNLIASLRARTADLYQRAMRAEAQAPALASKPTVTAHPNPDTSTTPAEHKPLLLTAAGWNEIQAKEAEAKEAHLREVELNEKRSKEAQAKEADAKERAERAERRLKEPYPVDPDDSIGE
jgi:hypothetical protein